MGMLNKTALDKLFGAKKLNILSPENANEEKKATDFASVFRAKSHRNPQFPHIKSQRKS